MITDKELAEQLPGGELANISLTFWLMHSIPKGKINPDHAVWDELKAFQAGWVACKQEYNIKP